MIKASALFYAIVVALLMALISSSTILFSYFNRLHFQSFQLQEQVMLNASSGINLLLANSAFLALNEQMATDLYGNGIDSVLLERRQWGAFEIVVSNAFLREIEFTKVAQIGANIQNDPKVALYLADQDKSLSLCGKTVINGTCFLPKAGVKRAYIEGQNFIGDLLIKGEVKESAKSLPEVNQSLLQYNINYFSGKTGENDSLVYMGEQDTNDTIIHSFKSSTMVLYSIDKIYLSNKYYEGNLRIVSAHSIYITANAHIQDVIIYAPNVEIEEGFTGNLQVFSTGSIRIGKKCTLNYPTVIVLVRTQFSPDNMELDIGEETTLSGVVFGYQDNMNNKKQLKLSVGKDALVIGQLYSSGYVELKGKIFGSLTCAKFILSTPSTMYENHLLNATIDNSNLSPHFAGISLVHHSQNKQIVKWLY